MAFRLQFLYSHISASSVLLLTQLSKPVTHGSALSDPSVPSGLDSARFCSKKQQGKSPAAGVFKPKPALPGIARFLTPVLRFWDIIPLNKKLYQKKNK